ncbi:hypothetical protein ABPG74_003696 [Tetrahymena malaccensis]
MSSSNFYDFKFQYGATSLLVIYFIYLSQQSKRKLFLQEISKKEWEFIGKNILPMSIMTVKYHIKSQQITLDKINLKANIHLHITSNQEFQQFTRNTIILDHNDNFQDLQICCKQGFFPNLSKSQSVKINNQIQETLEQKLLHTFKQETKQSHQFQDNLIDFFNNKKQKAQTQSAHEKENKNLIYDQSMPKESQFYGLLKQDGRNLKISFSTFTLQNQKNTFCCLLIREVEEQLQENKLSAFQNTKTIQEKIFFESYLYIGEKLQKIVENIQNKEEIKANVFQSYNRMYNIKDCFQILKNQFKMRLENSVISSISLQSLSNQMKIVIQSIQNKKNFQIQFVNCDSQTQINTYIDKLSQMLINLINSSTRENNNYHKKKQIKSNNYYLKLAKNQSSSEYTKDEEIQLEFDQQQQYNQYLRMQLDEASSSIQESYITNQELSLLNKQQQDEVIECKQEQKVVQQDFPAQNDIKIMFELLKGDNPISDIFKITIFQTKQNTTLSHILNILQNLDIQNENSLFEKSSYEQIEWKVNYNIIGNIGPFFNLYAKNLKDEGWEFHFYIFKNAEIIKSKDINKQQIFQNSLYQKNLSMSNQDYFHLNNIDDLKNQIKIYSSNSSIDFKTIEESSQQGRAVAKLEFENVKFNNFLEKESFSLQSSVNQSTIQFQKSTNQSIISPKSQQYQFKTKFMKQNHIIDQLSNKKTKV